jgi:hypothetical protein
MELAISAFLLFVGLTIGATFADIDLAPPLPLRHRSVWTHGPLLPWLLVGWGLDLHPLAWWFVVGFLPALTLHLLYDMFPRRWHGGATIKLFPLPGTLPAFLSFLFLAAGAGYSGYLFWQLVGGVVL